MDDRSKKIAIIINVSVKSFTRIERDPTPDKNYARKKTTKDAILWV